MARLLRILALRLGRLRADNRAVAAIEFAVILPVFLTMGLMGAEVAYMASVNMQVSQIALSLADNASRLGQTDNSSVTPTITGADIDSVMTGALQLGGPINLENQGRIVLSSLEFDDATGKQFIHWQRCRGSLDEASAYGNDGTNNGLGSTEIEGVGTSSTKIRAVSGSSVMVAEVYYRYEGIIANVLTATPTFRQEAVFAIRDDRNLNPGITGSGVASPCS